MAGPIKVFSFGKASYFVSPFDGYSGFSVVRFTHQKSDASNAVGEMIQLLKKLFNSGNRTLTCIRLYNVNSARSDDGGEYIHNGVQNWFRQRAICHEITAAYSPDSNGKAERLSLTLIYMAATMLVSKEVNRQDLWAEAVDIACSSLTRFIARSYKENSSPLGAICEYISNFA